MSYETEMNIIEKINKGGRFEKAGRDYLINSVNYTPIIRKMIKEKTFSLSKGEPTQLGQDLLEDYKAELAMVDQRYSGTFAELIKKDISKYETNRRPLYLIEQLKVFVAQAQRMTRMAEEEPNKSQKSLINGTIDKKMDIVFNKLLTEKDKQLLTQILLDKDSVHSISFRDTESEGSPWSNKTASRTKPTSTEPTDNLYNAVALLETMRVPESSLVQKFDNSTSRTQTIKSLAEADLLRLQQISSVQTDEFTHTKAFAVKLTSKGEFLAQHVLERAPHVERRQASELSI